MYYSHKKQLTDCLMMKQPKDIKVLITCEESGTVRRAFRALGFDAWSNDLLPSADESNFHLQMDARDAMKSRKWDLIIAHPYCTDTAVSGARWFKEKIRNGKQGEAISFFMAFVGAPCEHIAIEHPISIMSSVYRKPDQIIQPWQFGHGETKATCLWLKNLPKLKPTNIVSGREGRIWKMPPGKDRAKMRSRTYMGIASAMAEQWGDYLLANNSSEGL